MLSSITPLGERSRQRRWGWTVALLMAGAVVGGATTGALAGALGRLVSGKPAPAWVSALVLVTAGIFELTGRRVPSHRRQVDEDWLGRYRGWVVGGGFGLQLGTGLSTVVTSLTVYALFVVALLAASPVLGATVGAAFGLGRGLAVLPAATVTDGASLLRLHQRFQCWKPLASRVVAAGSLLTAFSILVFL